VARFEDVFVVVRWERANSVMTCNNKTAVIAGVAANKAFQPFTLLSSLARLRDLLLGAKHLFMAASRPPLPTRA
jgi:hypothetical protein